MFWKTIVFSVFVAFAYAEVSPSCNKAGLVELLNDARHTIQQWSGAEHAKDFHLYKVLEVTEKSIDQYEQLIKRCSDVEKATMLLPMLVGAGVVADDPSKAEDLLEAVEDEEFLGTVVSLFCAVDCSFLLNFTKKMETPASRTRMYNVMSHLLEKTDLNHTQIVTKLSFIRDVDAAVIEEKNEDVKHALEKLLLNAIKTDLVLQHDNIEKLLEINEVVTKKAIHELIDKFTNVSITSDDDLSLYPLFEILRCTANTDIWFENLEIAFNKLKEADKLKSAYTLVLLKSVYDLENKVTGANLEKLQHIKSEIPVVVKQAHKGHFCVAIDDEDDVDNKIFVLQSGTEYQVVKFEPKEDGPKALLTGVTDSQNYTLITEAYEPSETFYDSFGIAFKKEVGELTVIQNHKFCNTEGNSLFVCLPLKTLVPPASFGLEHFAVFKKLAKYYITMGSCDENVVLGA